MTNIALDLVLLGSEYIQRDGENGGNSEKIDHSARKILSTELGAVGKPIGEAVVVSRFKISSDVLAKCKESGLNSDEIGQLGKLEMDLLSPGKKAVHRRGTRGNPRTIFIDGQNAYLLLNTKEDQAIAKRGATHRPKTAIDLRTGKVFILLSRTFGAESDDEDSDDEDAALDEKEKHQRHIATAKALNSSRYFPNLISHHIEQSHKPGNEDIEKGWLIFEYCELGSLENYLDSNATIEEIEIHQMALDMLYGIREMHCQGFAHNDIHEGNIALCREDGRVRAKIIDLEYATAKAHRNDAHDLGSKCLSKLFERLENTAFSKILPPFPKSMRCHKEYAAYVASYPHLDQIIKDYEDALHKNHFTISKEGIVERSKSGEL